LDAFLDEIQRAHERHGQVVAVVPETLKAADGEPLTGAEVRFVDSFGHRYYPGPGPALAEAIRARLGLNARFDKPGTIARMSICCASEVDLAEAFEVGARAARLLAEGVSEVMVTIERLSDEPYRATTGTVPVAQVANRERRLPDEFIAPDGRSVTPAFRRWAAPLLGGPLPPYGRLLDLPLPTG
ncbi:MAG: phosphofructokinase, partial [Thermomicrobiaceae bacterium]|nr:phosphofructokinase [Thermomicrobiaceae bacterium]